ncbi:hypothetical protein QQS21_009221 [Conoideocrella luteorostrata]|uniref:DUF7907 domain-containing protein n=1 Tax=Conoideocrella luteorostrata TaxID=1105319 RepID=A0AAJ0CLR7_9HYPO|nr:hypothetical protein QQS21_009221 [Conoideocrella luteorostrata]
MFLSTAFLLGLTGLATASPIATRDDGPPTALPPASKSNGFNLIVNVTNLSRDFTPSIQSKYINSIHVGAGLSLVGVGNKEDNPRVFYVNGTAMDFHFASSTVNSDGGTPPSAYGISLTKDPDSDIAHTAHLDAGPGDKGIGLTRFPVPYTFLYPETYAICNESIPYYGGKKFLIVKQFQLGLKTEKDIPQNCVPVRLFAQCAKLNDLPPGSLASHQFAYETQCYDDVASIDWPKYRPW